MSGYLQRLARNAIQQAATIHPLLGSLFSAPTQAHNEPLEQSVVSLRSSPVSAGDDLQAQVAAAPRQSPSHVDDTRPAPNPLLPSIQTADAAPLPSTRETPDSSPTIAEAVSLRPLLSPMLETDSTPAKIEDSTNPVAELKNDEAGAQRVYTPLVTDSLARPVSQNVPAANSSLPPAALPRERRDSTARSQPEPDEIQIHIGRIEVTAVQQAPARPVARPSRKAPSLDDYLNRRGGRA
jgi:hypothetical protein